MDTYGNLNKKIDPNIIKWIDPFYIFVLYIFS